MAFWHRKKTPVVDYTLIPAHIGIIMDGNGRWAKKRGLPRSAGHRAGAGTLETITKFCNEIGVRYLTVYAFSTENWSRPKDEVEALMALLSEYLRQAEEKLSGKDVRIRVLGELSPFSDELKSLIAHTEEVSAHKKGMTLNIALNYGGRHELTTGVQALARQVQEGNLRPEDITEEIISDALYTKGMPDPDLIIRPSGEYRLSNFLLWQSAYSELWFDQICWPDFSKTDMLRAIADFQKRNRRYGGV